MTRATRRPGIWPRAVRTPVTFASRKNGRVAVQRIDNVGIVVESLDGAISFFAELGIELSRFLTPPTVADHRNAPVNALGYLRVMFAVDGLDDTLARLGEHGAQLVDEVVQYEDVYRLC